MVGIARTTASATERIADQGQNQGDVGCSAQVGAAHLHAGLDRGVHRYFEEAVAPIGIGTTRSTRSRPPVGSALAGTRAFVPSSLMSPGPPPPGCARASTRRAARSSPARQARSPWQDRATGARAWPGVSHRRAPRTCDRASYSEPFGSLYPQRVSCLLERLRLVVEVAPRSSSLRRSRSRHSP